MGTNFNGTMINQSVTIAEKAGADIAGPCYVRLGRGAVEDVYDENYKFELGKGKVLREGKRTTIGNTFLGKKKISFQEKRGNEKKSPKGFSDARRVVP